MGYLIPHTPEWFKALEALRPDQAAATRQVLDLAGSTDVCSICGDAPAKDYRVVGVKFGPNLDATVRLCDDCRDIRSQMYGELFSEISA